MGSGAWDTAVPLLPGLPLPLWRERLPLPVLRLPLPLPVLRVAAESSAAGEAGEAWGEGDEAAGVLGGGRSPRACPGHTRRLKG